MNNTHPAGHARAGLLAAAAAARDDGKKERNPDERKDPQPVHPILRMPPNADWLRYVSSNRFVPQASHFASMI